MLTHSGIHLDAHRLRIRSLLLLEFCSGTTGFPTIRAQTPGPPDTPAKDSQTARDSQG